MRRRAGKSIIDLNRAVTGSRSFTPHAGCLGLTERENGSVSAVALDPGADRAFSASWSPDGQWIAYVRGKAGVDQLAKIRPGLPNSVMVLANAKSPVGERRVVSGRDLDFILHWRRPCADFSGWQFRTHATVDENFSGVASGSEATVYTGMGGGDCGYPFVPGVCYLV